MCLKGTFYLYRQITIQKTGYIPTIKLNYLLIMYIYIATVSIDQYYK